MESLNRFLNALVCGTAVSIVSYYMFETFKTYDFNQSPETMGVTAILGVLAVGLVLVSAWDFA